MLNHLGNSPKFGTFQDLANSYKTVNNLYRVTVSDQTNKLPCDYHAHGVHSEFIQFWNWYPEKSLKIWDNPISTFSSSDRRQPVSQPNVVSDIPVSFTSSIMLYTAHESGDLVLSKLLLNGCSSH